MNSNYEDQELDQEIQKLFHEYIVEKITKEIGVPLKESDKKRDEAEQKLRGSVQDVSEDVQKIKKFLTGDSADNIDQKLEKQTKKFVTSISNSLEKLKKEIDKTNYFLNPSIKSEQPDSPKTLAMEIDRGSEKTISEIQKDLQGLVENIEKTNRFLNPLSNNEQSGLSIALRDALKADTEKIENINQFCEVLETRIAACTQSISQNADKTETLETGIRESRKEILKQQDSQREVLDRVTATIDSLDTNQKQIQADIADIINKNAELQNKINQDQEKNLRWTKIMVGLLSLNIGGILTLLCMNIF